MYNETYTITFGDCAENHKNMQLIGKIHDKGFDRDDLIKFKKWFRRKRFVVELYNLKKILPDELINEAENAHILIIRNGLNAFVNPNDFHNEQTHLEKDKKALMYGRVVNKYARHNLCFADETQEPNYEEGKGRIFAFDDLPLLNKVRNKLFKLTGDKLVAEGNYYYDLKRCGIGYHGDMERRKVIAVRTGATFPICYNWFYKGIPIGENIKFNLNHGDIYFMSDKATGNDWKKKNIMTLRHAAGVDKFIKINIL
jgi:hypothetical protein